MARRRLLSYVALACLVALSYQTTVASPGAQAKGRADPVSEPDSVAAQVADLRKEVAGLRAQPRVVAAGTATWTRPDVLANRTSVRVPLPAEIVAHLGTDYVVALGNRLPGDGYP